MRIVVDIPSCSVCVHQDHSGAFTPGGAVPVCNHRDIIEQRKVEHPGLDEYHWKWRKLPDWNCEPPQWCPLRTGAKYGK